MDLEAGCLTEQPSQELHFLQISMYSQEFKDEPLKHMSRLTTGFKLMLWKMCVSVFSNTVSVFMTCQRILW